MLRMTDGVQNDNGVTDHILQIADLGGVKKLDNIKRLHKLDLEEN